MTKVLGPPRKAVPHGDAGTVARSLTAGAIKAIGATGDLARCELRRTAEFSKIRTSRQDSRRYAQTAAQVARDAAALALMENDSATSLKGRPSGSKAGGLVRTFATPDVEKRQVKRSVVRERRVACRVAVRSEYLIGRVKRWRALNCVRWSR